MFVYLQEDRQAEDCPEERGDLPHLLQRRARRQPRHAPFSADSVYASLPCSVSRAEHHYRQPPQGLFPSMIYSDLSPDVSPSSPLIFWCLLLFPLSIFFFFVFFLALLFPAIVHCSVLGLYYFFSRLMIRSRLICKLW